MKTLLISDSIGMGIMEVRPEPAWRVRLTALRNKDLLAPDYGAMHVAAYLKGLGHDIRVVNVVADVQNKVELFEESNAEPDELSGSIIARPDAPRACREYLFKTLDEYRPDVVLLPLSIYNLALYSKRLLEEIKKACPGSLLVAGGIYATFHAGEILAEGNADVVIRGEGEITTAELLRAIEAGNGYSDVPGISYRNSAGIHHNPPREPVSDLDVLPHLYTASDDFNIKTRFDILSALNPYDDYIPGAGFLTSRGCPEVCTFCLDPAINNRRTRFHSPEYVRDVLDYCSEKFSGKNRGFFFGDATFTMNKKRMKRILGLLGGLPYSYQIQTRADYLDSETTRMLFESNFTTVAIGAETFNEKILKEVVRKRVKASAIIDAALGVRDSGMRPVLTFIVGLPGESRESVERTLEILKENKLLDATFFPLVVFKGTALYDTFRSSARDADIELARLNQASEEFLFLSDEFPTPEELTGFTEEINTALIEARSSIDR